jgi:hypothetical protein
LNRLRAPRPAKQLARLPPPADAPAKAARRRAALVDALDTLGSHLPSTFAALAHAFAHAAHPCTHARAAVALVLGPSVQGARAKVLLVVDGIEAREWGARELVAPV